MKNNLLIEQLSYNGEEITPTSVQLISYSSNDLTKETVEYWNPEEKELDKDKTYWIKVDGLNQIKTISSIANTINLNFLLTQDVLNINHPTKIEEYENFILLVLKYFIVDEDDNYVPLQISIVLGSNYIITFSERKHPFMEDIIKALEQDVFHIRKRGADYLLSVILNSITANYTTAILQITDYLDDLEEELLSISTTKNLGIEIQTNRKQYLSLKKAILPLKEQYARLFRANNKLITPKNRAFFNDVNDHLQFVLQNIEMCRETISSLVDLFISNNDLKMNDIMKRLTIVSTIFIPLTFLVGVWGMNFSFMPELSWKYGYITAWGIMLFIGLIIYFYFKIKKWY